MSLNAVLSPASGTTHATALRLGLTVLALALAAALLGALAWMVAPSLAAAPPRSPFGIGFREASPAGTGIGAWILAVQASFSRTLQSAVAALKAGGDWSPIIGFGFAYGVFHAAGPGHGKAVIAGYIMAGERTLLRGLSLSTAAALLQATVAILIVAIGALLLNATAAEMTRAGTLIETASFACVALVGAALTWRKAGHVVRLGETLQAGRDASAVCGADCSHVHLSDAERIARVRTWREWAGVVVAAGTRPCAGAVLILVFALSQGILAAGIAATLAMALGTAVTTGALASLAVFAKRLALRLAAGRSTAGPLVAAGLELLAAAFVFALGLAMLSGLALGGAG